MVLFKNPRDVSQIMALAHQMYPRRTQFLSGSLCPSHGQTSRLHGDRYETKHAGYLEIENLHLSRWGTGSVCRVIKRMLHPVSCHSCIRCWGNNMVSRRLKKHASDIVYLQKTKPCIRKHLITKADRSLVDCLCECADNISRGNVPLTKRQKE
jgi:hypothetical protein